MRHFSHAMRGEAVTAVTGIRFAPACLYNEGKERPHCSLDLPFANSACGVIVAVGENALQIDYAS